MSQDIVADALNKMLNAKQVKRAINDLEKRNIISLQEINGQIHVLLEEKGQQKIAKYSLKKILEYKIRSKKWNGKWFMIFFDIPETQRNKRDYLRKFLKTII